MVTSSQPNRDPLQKIMMFDHLVRSWEVGCNKNFSGPVYTHTEQEFIRIINNFTKPMIYVLYIDDIEKPR